MTKNTARTLWHYWCVCAVWGLWNALAAVDYVFSVVQGEAYYRAAGMSEFQVDYFSYMPLWVSAAWTVSVWAAVLSAALLFMRRAVTVWALRVAMAGTAGYCLYAYLMSDGVAAMGDMWFMPLVILVVMIVTDVYVQWIGRRGQTG